MQIHEVFEPSLPKVRLGTILAFAALTCLFAALRLGKIGVGEQPRRSKMRWLSEMEASSSAGRY